jgi:hypothetical protein
VKAGTTSRGREVMIINCAKAGSLLRAALVSPDSARSVSEMRKLFYRALRAACAFAQEARLVQDMARR